ncbi:MAG: hypothetical protein ACRDAM_06105, partial [Casimicrobium sp.]
MSRQDLIAQASTARGLGNSQATAVEQSRAVAEVQAAFMVAMNRPRDKTAALSEAMESCATFEVAEGAFFRFSRGGQTVSGESIHLARELARCWGNITYGVVELDRDDDNQRSEMMAYALDLQTNTRSHITFIVPHRRDKRDGPVPITDMRDIYENNANMGARRLRECIFSVLPPYLVKACADTCRKTLEGGTDSKPIAVRIAEAISAFESIGVARDRIEARYGAIDKLTAVDLVNLRVSYQSIQRNEISADDEFPRTDRIAASELLSNSQGQANQASAIVEAQENDSSNTHQDNQGAPAGGRPPCHDKLDEWLARLGSDDLFAPEIKVIEAAFLK